MFNHRKNAQNLNLTNQNSGLMNSVRPLFGSQVFSSEG